MLQHLTISHYALIEQLDINWESGFSVITGETGAGKSIMLGALNLLLGGRADAKSIQAGHNKCMVEAIFNIEGLDLEPFFTRNDIDYDPKECVVRREVSQSGKSRAFINDTPVAAAKLKEIGAVVIDIHSQHQNLLIRNEMFLIDTLDVMAENQEQTVNYQKAYRQLKTAQELLNTLKERAEKGNADKEYMEFRLAQIQTVNPIEGEVSELEQELSILSHAEDIKQALLTAHNLVNPEEESTTQKIRQATETLRNIIDNYAQANELAERLESVRIELNDISSELESHAEHIEYDPERLQYIEERLSAIYDLQQKFHVQSEHELLAIAADLQSQLNDIENIDDDIRRQQEKVEALRSERNRAAAQLTSTRIEAAKTIAQNLIAALKNLGMPHVVLQLQISPRTESDTSGADKVVFLFSANKNVPPQDVSQTASGGEIARLMLALKALISQHKKLPTVIFDEIDTGVSGNMAEQMARVMRNMACNCQVLCITHLPQIAALGNHHFKVYKEDSELTTRSHIVPLRTDERVEEIAHMLSGAEITQAAMDNARELLNA